MSFSYYTVMRKLLELAKTYIKDYIRRIKSKRMNNQLNTLLQSIPGYQHRDITNITFIEGKCEFFYRGGKFIVVKVLPSQYPNIGKLFIYHDTNFQDEVKIVPTFEVIVNNGLISLRNHLDLSRFTYLKNAVNANGYMNVLQDNFAEMFINQFVAFMLNNPFDIYPFN